MTEVDHDWRRQMEAYGYDSVSKVTDLIAAAREAGRIDTLLTEGTWIAKGKVDEMVAAARLVGERLGKSLCELLGRYVQEGDGGAVGTLTRILAERDRLRLEAG